MRRIYLPMLAGMVLFSLFTRETAARDISETGKSAPGFELVDILGKKVSLSDFKGNVVLLNFWATWCSSCRAEMPSLNSLHTGYKDQGFAVVSITIDRSEKTVAKFVADKDILFPVLLDKDKEVSFDDYAVVALPVSILIDRNGMIVERLIGERKWDSPEMKEKVLKLLKKGG